MQIKITQEDLKDLERFANEMFEDNSEAKKMTFHFSNHFSNDRINHPRNVPSLKINELKKLLTKLKLKKSSEIYAMKDGDKFTVTCTATNISMVFAVSEEILEKQLIHKNLAVTIIRKKDFSSYNGDIILEI